MSSIAYLAGRHLGTRTFGTLYGTISAAIASGVSTATRLANFIFDRTASYAPVIWGNLPVLGLAASSTPRFQGIRASTSALGRLDKSLKYGELHDTL